MVQEATNLENRLLNSDSSTVACCNFQDELLIELSHFGEAARGTQRENGLSDSLLVHVAFSQQA